MRTFIMPYKRGSKGAAALAQALGILQVRLEGSRLRGSDRITLINWGSSTFHNNVEFPKCKVLNTPEFVGIYSDKLKFFKLTDPELTVPWTEDLDKVKQWAMDGKTVFARKILNGHSGVGIVEMTRENLPDWVKAPLYTLYVPKESEYRIHFFNGKIIDRQKKALSRERAVGDDPNVWKVRNLANGFVFARHFGDTPIAVESLMEKFLTTCELDFGAADVIYNKRQDRAYLLEVNTAPGLMGSTVDAYKEAFKEIIV